MFALKNEICVIKVKETLIFILQLHENPFPIAASQAINFGPHKSALF